MTGKHAWQLWLAVALMPVNWALETYKWYVLVNKFQPISFAKSFESVLSGLSFAMNTPNRIGEYGGRILYLQPAFRLRGIALTVFLQCFAIAHNAYFRLHQFISSETTIATGTFCRHRFFYTCISAFYLWCAAGRHHHVFILFQNAMAGIHHTTFSESERKIFICLCA
jgi:Uncharacterised protein family (UPF0104).